MTDGPGQHRVPPYIAASLEQQAVELYEDAPCGYLSTLPDGTIIKVNRTLLEWTGFARADLLGLQFARLLTAGGRIYHETHYAPLLALQGRVREIAVEIVRADGTRMPALVNAVLKRDEDGAPLLINTTIFDASERRSYERELLAARERERSAREREAEVAQQLQRSMLDRVTLDDARVRVGTSYRPAVETLEVGGDWHDAFPLGPDRVAVVVGDVVGRGLEAATAMGQLRSATRALAGAGLGGPADVFAALDGFAARTPGALMATLAYAELDLAGDTLQYACAGHPPPVLLAPGRAPAVLWEGRTLPLGLGIASESPTVGTAQLVPGTRLVLYTDGLVERRDEPLDRGLSRVAGASHALRDHDPQTFADELVVAVAVPDASRDDVCVLCAERSA